MVIFFPKMASKLSESSPEEFRTEKDHRGGMG